MKYPELKDDSPLFFVNGAASAVGIFVVQLARLAGYRVFASASPRSFELVESFGADQVFDYKVSDHF